MKKIPTAIEVVAIALIAEGGQVLMQRRAQDRAHAGLWEFPGGKVEPGESDNAALLREVREELDLDLSASNLHYLAEARDAGAAVAIRLYTCRTWLGDPACLDADELGWFDPAELLTLPMPPLDVPLAKALQNKLKQAK